MKKLMIICGLLFSAVTFANAQQGGGQGGQGGGQGRRMQMSPEDRVKQLDEKLKLTDDQKTKVTAIYTAQAADMKKMREEMQAGGGDRAAMMEKMQKANADLDVKINAVLTAEQKTAYKTWQDEMKAQREKMMKERQQGGGGQGGGNGK